MKSSKATTRNFIYCPVFGAPADFKQTMLPTNADVMRCYTMIQHEIQPKSHNKKATVTAVSEILSKRIELLWFKSSIPVISHKRVLEKIRLFHNKYRNLLKPYSSRKNAPKYAEKITSFADEASTSLFDIAACKCLDMALCHCTNDKKVPHEERDFLVDQRSARKMMIGHVDVKMTNKLKRRHLRKLNEARKIARHLENSTAVKDAVIDQSDISDVEASDTGKVLHTEVEDDSDSVAHTSSHLQKKCNSTPQSQMRLPLPNVARECDRHGVSDRCAASIVSAVLQDVGLVSANDSSLVVDKNKIRRERFRLRRQLGTESAQPLTGLYFDGRKDKTKVNIRKGSKYYGRTVVEEHISLIQEPSTHFIGHITPANGGSKSIKDGILQFLEKRQIDTGSLIAIGCDGTNVNTGAVAGVIRLLEEELGHPVQWLICLLHANELPLRHLIHKLDGVTQGPTGFSGIIGKAIETCEELPVVNYIPITFANCPCLDGVDLSTDQQYLYDICLAVSSGECSTDLASRRPGPVVHSRWLTTANRLLRLYISTDCPSVSLIVLATYVINVYAPVWFNIKSKSSCSEGTRHLWNMIKLSRYLAPEYRSIVDSTIQRNGYFGHSENIILAMLTDDREMIRQLAYRRIIAARRENADSTTIRQFRIPKLNFAANDYTELVEWQSIDKCEPPMTKYLTDSDLQVCVETRLFEKVNFQDFPCHNQATERCIRLVTQASAAVCGDEQRDGFIRAKLKSRIIMKHFNTKSEFRLA
jgi:hypothetical protein